MQQILLGYLQNQAVQGIILKFAIKSCNMQYLDLESEKFLQ